MKSHIIVFFLPLLLHFQHVLGTPTILDAEGASQDPKSTDQCPSDRRSLWNIIVVCLTTIYLSTWTAIHPNVPGDRLTTRKRAWFFLFLRRLRLMVMAIVIPEVTVAWAAAQFIDAWNIRHPETDLYTYVFRWFLRKKDIPEPRLNWEHAFGIVMGLFYCGGSSSGQDSVSTHEDFIYLLTPEDLDTKKLSRPDDGALEDSEMIHNIDTTAKVLQELKNIRDDSIKDRSKNDIVTKAITVIQLIWFVTQCIGRHAQNLPVTLLEISTLAIATLSIILSLLWMNKPCDIQTHTGVPVETHSRHADVNTEHTFTNLLEGTRAHTIGHWLSLFCNKIKEIFDFLLVFSSNSPQTRWNGILDYASSTPKRSDTIVKRFIIVSLTGALFGAIHCTAFAFNFPSQLAGILWQFAAVSGTVLPVPIIFYLASVTDCFFNARASLAHWATLFLGFLLVLMYLVCRAILIILPFYQLAHLPDKALCTVEWSTFIPHVS